MTRFKIGTRLAISIATTLTLMIGVATAQEQSQEAIKRLAFLSGSWNCVVEGRGVPSGTIDHLDVRWSLT